MAHNRVVWSEGLFLRPQHFQQQGDYLERYVDLKLRAARPDGWGFAELELERDLLAVGKFALRRAVGAFPDGTPFSLPDDGPLPPAWDVPAQTRDSVVYLALPLRTAGRLDFEREAGQEPMARYQLHEVEVRDATSLDDRAVLVEAAVLRPRCLLSSDVLEGYACVPMAQIVECRADGQVVLDASFMASALEVRAAPPLASFVAELQGMLRQRGNALAGRVTTSGRGGAAEIADFLFLQAINRWEPLLAHWAGGGALHPEALYRACVSMLGEFSTFTASTRRFPQLPPYRHDALRESFTPLIAGLRACLSAVLEQNAIPIPLVPKKYGISVAVVNDRTLFDSSAFVLAVRGDLPPEDLRRSFPAHLKIGPVEKIRELVNLQLPGVSIDPLPVAPRQIPYHAGSVYFELNSGSPLWKVIKQSGGLATHVGGEFPGLAMELWAIRG